MLLGTIELPDDLLWIDEFDWNPVAQEIDRTLTGGLIIQEQSKLYGRPVTLSGENNSGWVTRATVNQVVTLSESANSTLSLTLPDSRVLSVIFDRANGSIMAQPLFYSSNPALDDYYSITIRLLTVI